MTVYRPNIEQDAFIFDNDSRWCLGDGPRGGGKTVALALKAVSRLVPGACEGLFRQKLIDLKRTTLKALLEGDYNVPPILPPGSYKHKKDLKEIVVNLPGGTAKIVYNGMDQADAAQIGGTGSQSSLNLTGAGFDEWVEIGEGNVIQVAGCVRVPIPGIKNQIYGVCNPGPPSHHLATRFGLDPGGSLDPRCARHFMSMDANKANLSPEFIEDMDSLTGVAYQRYRLGMWVGSDGLVYDNWQRDVHVVERDRSEMVRWSVGVDEGVTNPFAGLLIGYDPDGRAHVFAEAYESGLTHEKMVDRLELLSLPRVERVMYDAAAKALGLAIRQRGLHAIPADKGEGSVVRGIQKVRQRLATIDATGMPRLTVDPSCTNLIREFESYEWKPDRPKDEPKKENDHALDALRYEIDREDESSGLSVYTGAPARKSSGRVSAWEDPTFV